MIESKSIALPLGYAPMVLVEEDGFEPSNPKELIYSQPRLATSLLLQDSAYFYMVDVEGLEPPTSAV
jgi:hypothetical protein